MNPADRIHPKVLTSGIAGLLTSLVVWSIGHFAHVQLQPDTASTLTAIFSFGIGYITPSER